MGKFPPTRKHRIRIPRFPSDIAGNYSNFPTGNTHPQTVMFFFGPAAVYVTGECKHFGKDYVWSLQGSSLS